MHLSHTRRSVCAIWMRMSHQAFALAALSDTAQIRTSLMRQTLAYGNFTLRAEAPVTASAVALAPVVPPDQAA